MPGLTRDDIRRLAGASSVSFHRLPGRAPGDLIVAHDERHFGEWRCDFAVELAVHATVRDFTPARGARTAHSCYSLVSCAALHQPWQTAVSLLRPGDRLGLLWVAANDSADLRRYGYHADELHLEVRRAGRRAPLVFSIDHRVGPDNTARMIRHVTVGAAPAAPASPPDLAGLLRAAGAVLAERRLRRATLAVPPAAAVALGALVRVGGVEARVRADRERADDEVVVLDVACRRFVGVAWSPPAGLRGSMYTALRAGGAPPGRAAELTAAVHASTGR